MYHQYVNAELLISRLDWIQLKYKTPHFFKNRFSKRKFEKSNYWDLTGRPSLAITVDFTERNLSVTNRAYVLDNQLGLDEAHSYHSKNESR